MSTPLEAIKALRARPNPAAPLRPFIVITPDEARNPALIKALRKSGCALRVRETPDGPTVPLVVWLKK